MNKKYSPDFSPTDYNKIINSFIYHHEYLHDPPFLKFSFAILEVSIA